MTVALASVRTSPSSGPLRPAESEDAAGQHVGEALTARRHDLGFWTLLGGLAVAALSGCGHDCGNPQSSWCEGNVLRYCAPLETGSHADPPTEVQSFPCATGLTCVEFPPSEIPMAFVRSQAACVDLTRCDGRASFCVELVNHDAAVSCGTDGAGVIVDVCGHGEEPINECHCVESDMTAECVDLGIACPWQ
jgi:hypothetical protein